MNISLAGIYVEYHSFPNSVFKISIIKSISIKQYV